MVRRYLTVKLAAAIALGLLGVGSALAAAGVVPGVARNHIPDRVSLDVSTPSQTKGIDISTLARTTTATGVDKGAVISTAASGGKSQAGENGLATGAAGLDKADEASGGASEEGTSIARAARRGDVPRPKS